MPFYTEVTADAAITAVRGATGFREEKREWWVALVSGAPNAVAVFVYDDEAAAVAQDGTHAAQGISFSVDAAGTHDIALTEWAPNGPVWETVGSSIQLDVTGAMAGTELSVWKVDLGLREDRILQRVMRGMMKVTTANGYLHTLTTIALGGPPAPTIPVAAMPYVIIGRGRITVVREELGGGPKTYEMVLEGRAITSAPHRLDANLYGLFHDLRRAIDELGQETYIGDGETVKGMVVDMPDITRPAEWTADAGVLEFDVRITYEMGLTERLAG